MYYFTVRIQMRTAKPRACPGCHSVWRPRRVGLPPLPIMIGGRLAQVGWMPDHRPCTGVWQAVLDLPTPLPTHWCSLRVVTRNNHCIDWRLLTRRLSFKENYMKRPQTVTYMINIAIPLACSHLTFLAHSKCQGQAHFDCEYFVNDREGKHCYCLQIESRIRPFH